MALRLHLLLHPLQPLLHLLDHLGDPPWPSPGPQLGPDPGTRGYIQEDTSLSPECEHYNITLQYSDHITLCKDFYVITNIYVVSQPVLSWQHVSENPDTKDIYNGRLRFARTLSLF